MKPFSLLLFLLPVIIAGCSGSKLKTSLNPSPSDWAMYGKVPERRFFDSTSFTFPLEPVWEYDVSAGFAQSPIAIVGSTLLVGTLQGEVHAVNLETGKRIGFLKTFSPVHAAPAYFTNLLVIGLESSKENLIAYKTETGEDRWIRDLGGVVASPLVWDGRLIAGGLNGNLTCFGEYGVEQWSVDMGSEIRSSPALANGIAYCATARGEVFAVNANDGNVIWKAKTNNAVYAGITVADSTLIVASRDSSMYFFDAGTGTLKRKIDIGNILMATPSVYNDIVYISSLEGTVSAFKIETGELLWIFKAQSAINTTPFVTPSAVFVTSLDKNIYALNPANGSLLWKKELENRIKTTPLVWNGMLLVAAEDRTIYCFKSAR